MASLTPFSKKKILILDDLPEVRGALRTQMTALGCPNVAMAGTVRAAVEQLEQGSFDVILCDYYLGGGTDGQQFLEYGRNRRLISRGTLFVMITAEKSYVSVVTAAECLPDDYLLKPFTTDLLQQRLERLLDKKARLARVDAMQDKENWPEVVAACDEIIASGDRYQADALRIRGNALIACGRLDEAAAFYNQVLTAREMPWARFGLARTQYAQGELGACKLTLDRLIHEAPQLLSAYDLLGRAHLDSGRADEALKVLDRACAIAPDSLTRHRAIALVAERQGDFTRVEGALARALAADSSDLPQDVAVGIARACLATGRTAEGEEILKRVVQNNPDSVAVHQQVAGVLDAHGAGDRADALIQSGKQEIVELNNEAVRRGRAGQLGEAAKMLTEAANRLPGNVQIVANAAFALLLDVFNNGLDAGKLREALRFQKSVMRLDARHPKLADITELQRRIQTRYGQPSTGAKG